jgi:iron-sulfur cluster repair protein YtfE (RIC family)
VVKQLPISKDLVHPEKRAMTLQPSRSASPFTGEDATPADTGELVAYILERFHKGHRRDLPGLIVLARKVEGAHDVR